MATRAGVGRSLKRDPVVAGREAAELAIAPLDGHPADLLLVFGTGGYDQPALISSIQSVAPGARLSGCTGEGIIAPGASDECDHALGVLAVQSDAFEFETFLVPDYGVDSAAAGAELARQVQAVSRGDELGLLIFPDGLLGNCAQLLRSLDSAFASKLPIAGGAAGDQLTFMKTWQYHDGRPATGAVAALLIRGAGRLEISVSHGCVPIGLERHVTRADGAWVQEIDGRPAWSVFREYLDGDPEDLNTEGAIHLSVGVPLPENAGAEYEPFVIQTPFGLDKPTGALYFPGGGIHGNSTIRLARREPNRIRENARAAARRIADRRAGRDPAFVLQFDCAGRGRQLFGSEVADQIVNPLQLEFRRGTPWLGFHTYGEIAPIGGSTYYHNFTVALCALYEDRRA